MLLYGYVAAVIIGAILLLTTLLLGHDTDTEAEVRGELSDIALPLLSVRFWVFFLSVFGLTGTLLTLSRLAGPLPALVTALVAALVGGFSVAWVVQRRQGAKHKGSHS